MPKNTEQLPLWTTRSQGVSASFDAEHTTSDAGVALLHLADQKLGLCNAMAKVIQDRRNPLCVQHPLEELLQQRIFQIAMGWEDCNDAATLRHHPAYKLAVGRQPVSGADLASQPTLSRLENAVDEDDLMRLWDLLIDQYIARQPKDKRRITIDADGTNAQTYGNQQLSLFNGLYDQTCYMPLLIFASDDQSLPGVPGNFGLDRGRSGDGLAPQDLAGRRRGAISSRVDPDRSGQTPAAQLPEDDPPGRLSGSTRSR